MYLCHGYSNDIVITLKLPILNMCHLRHVFNSGTLFQAT